MSGVKTSDGICPSLPTCRGSRTGNGDGQSSTPESFSLETKYVVLNFLSIASSESSPVRTPGTSSSSPSVSGSWTKTKISPSKLRQWSRHTNDYCVGDTPELSAKELDELIQKPGSWQPSTSSSELPSSQDSADVTDANHMGDIKKNLDKSTSSNASEEIALVGQIGEDHSTFSWKRSPQFRRTVSEFTSDSGDNSYVSDADDEMEDTSNASSIMGNNSRSKSNMDFLQAVSRLPTVHSESELELEPFKTCDTETDRIQFQGDLDDKLYTEENDCDYPDGLFEDNTSSQEDTEGATAPRRPQCNRSNLKLNLEHAHDGFPPDATRLSFQAGIQQEMTSLESEVEDAIRKQNLVFQAPILAPLTPQTEAARLLARIGDEVRDQYGSQLNVAMGTILSQFQSQAFTYETFRASACYVIDDTMPGWRQNSYLVFTRHEGLWYLTRCLVMGLLTAWVALLLVYSQQVALLACKRGQKSLSHVLDYTTILVADLVADFIIKQGGWGAIMNYDPSQSSESPDSDANERYQDQLTPTQRHSSSDTAPQDTEPGSHTDDNDTCPGHRSWLISPLRNSIVLSISFAFLTVAVSVALFRR